jgi:hypothetical protein
MIMDKKTLSRIGTMLVLVVAISLTFSGCDKKPTEQKAAEQKSETASDSEKSTGTDCSAGFLKTVAGMKYQRTGTESQVIQGKTMNLCCWDKVNDQGQKEKKICGDRNESPVGYTSGILWEMEKGTGNAVKAMETYQKEGKSCQQHYEKDGSLGPESCK